MKINCYPLFFKLLVVKYYIEHPKIIIKEILLKFNISNGTLYNWINLNLLNKLSKKKSDHF